MNNKLPFFKNIYDSKIIDIWFSSLAYIAISSTLFILFRKNGQFLFAVLVFISYLFAIAKVIHGTRPPYEYLKKIYVNNQNTRIFNGIFYIFIFFTVYLNNFSYNYFLSIFI